MKIKQYKQKIYKFISVGLIGVSVLCSGAALADTVTVSHIMGETTLNTSPEKIVVIGIGALDAVDAFGVEPVAVSKVAAFPDYLSKYADDKYASAGTIFEPDFESIYMQKPDLIIVGPRSSKHYEELSKIAPTFVYAVNNGDSYWSDTKVLWEKLGKVLDREELVENKINALDSRFKSIEKHNKEHDYNALMVMSSGSNITAFNENSRFASLYKDFGFKPSIQMADNADKKSAGGRNGGHGNLVSYELIKQNNPSTLFVLDRDKLVNRGKSTTHQDFENDLVKATQAYQNNRMVFLDITAWYVAGSGVHATEQMLRDIEQLN
ncbi:MAG: siderophore ABC transporter substrate-binding protein [Vibrio sp.]|uniref:siderophore ABC transporter substrate-binding protein n=1 Tax=Vibrio sp. TaxID=678 RepID=UPI003A879682